MGTIASTALDLMTAGDVRTEVIVGIWENCVAWIVWACTPVIHLMNVRSAAMFFECGLTYRFHPPMFE